MLLSDHQSKAAENAETKKGTETAYGLLHRYVVASFATSTRWGFDSRFSGAVCRVSLPLT
jgi:hypothetical protein